MGKLLRSESLAEIIFRIEKAESLPNAPTRPLENAAPKIRSIWAAEGWLYFGDAPIPKSQALAKWIKKSIKARSLTSAFASGLVPSRVKTRSKARALKVKNNILALYPDYGVIAKLARENGVREAGDIQNEYFVLRELWEKKRGVAPQPIAFDEEANLLWIAFIQAVPLSDTKKEKYTVIFLKLLFECYEMFGASRVLLGEVEPMCLADLAVGEVLESEGISHAHLERLLRDSGELNVIQSRIHGDALTENLLLQGGVDAVERILISDWELSRWGPVEFDVNSLYMQHAQGKILEMYGAWAKARGFEINVRANVAACGILRNLRWLSEYRRFESARGDVRASKHHRDASLKDLNRGIAALERSLK